MGNDRTDGFVFCDSKMKYLSIYLSFFLGSYLWPFSVSADTPAKRPTTLIGLYPTGKSAPENPISPRLVFDYLSDPITRLGNEKVRFFVNSVQLKDWKLSWGLMDEQGNRVPMEKLEEMLSRNRPFRLYGSALYDGSLFKKPLEAWKNKSPSSAPPEGVFLSRTQQENLRPELLPMPAVGVSVKPTLPGTSFFTRWFRSPPRRFSAGDSNRPTNVVMILVDTLRADHTPPYGHPFVVAPHIDLLASLGWVFTRSYGASSSTRPSVGSIFTGLQPAAHGAVRHATQAAWLHLGVPLLAQAFQKAGFSTAGISSNAQITGQFGFDGGFQAYECPVWEKAVTPRAIRQLQTLSEPFFLYLHYNAPHAPYEPPPEWRGLYDHLTPSPEEDRYCAEITTDDRRIGLVLKELAKQGLLDRTLIWLVSDHGEEFWEHGWNGHGAKVFEETVRTVSIVADPLHLPMGVRCDQPVTHVDIFPTLTEWFGWKKPRYVQGISWLPILQGRETTEAAHRPLFLHHGGGLGPGAHESDKEAVLLDNQKLIWWTQKNEWELYDLHLDPGEKQNQWRPGLEIQPLESLLKKHLEECRIIGMEYTLPNEAGKSVELRPAEIENLKAGGYLQGK